MFGSTLKIDSTKTVVKKLQGAACGSARCWATNVENEQEEVLQSVLTALKGLELLQPLAEGLVDRYERADE